MSKKTVTLYGDLPKDPHWAVLVYGYVTVPGYDRGDPDDRKDIVEYITFSTKEELESWVLAATRGYDKKSFSVLFVKPAKVETTVNVKVVLTKEAKQ
jgi:hypothetical protein